MIGELGLAGFFLLHHDMLELAREVALEVRGPDSVRALLAPGRGRGSSVSSLVCYLIGLSHIDPIANRLTLGRFLHEDLRGLPDIDLDFPRDIREVLIPRVHERYGHDHAALVAAFPTFRARGAIRELGKVLGLPAGEIERIARGAERYGPGAEHDMAVGPGASARRAGTRRGARRRGAAGRPPARLRSAGAGWRGWCEEAYGLPRHLSQHSGGMIVATRPLIDCCPVVPAAMEGRQMVQWDKDSCADAGFLKIDLLGPGDALGGGALRGGRSRARAASASTCRASPSTISRDLRGDSRGRHGRRLSDREPRADAVAAAHAAGEPRGPDDPGRDRAARARSRAGRSTPTSSAAGACAKTPRMRFPTSIRRCEPVLKETLGTIIFQDQVMQVAEAFAGFTPGEADGLRRAMSRKRSQEMLQRHRERFIAGRACAHAGAELRDGRARVADGRGLRRLRLPQGPQRRLRPARLPVDVAARALRPGVPVRAAQRAADGLLRPRQPRARGRAPRHRGARPRRERLARCSARCEDGGVRLGLGYIKDVAGAEMRELVAERERNGPFRSLGELAARVGAGHRTLEQLAWSGACDGLTTGPARLGEAGRRSALWQLGVAAPGSGAGEGTQLALPLELPAAPRLRPLGRWQRLIADYATSGVTVGDHAMAVLRERL